MFKHRPSHIETKRSRVQQVIQFMLISTVSLLAACGSGGGGGGGVGAVALATGEFTKTVILDGANSFWLQPFDTTATGDRFQILYRASELSGSGKITSISFQRELDSVVASCPNVTIRMGHTSLTALTTTFASNVEQGKGSFELALDNSTVAIAAGLAGTYFDINLATPFNYNGVDNLVVEIDRSTACDVGISLDTTASSSPYAAVVWSATSGAATGSLRSYPPHIKFTFAGGDDAQVYSAGTTTNGPFHTTAPKIQSLYTAADIDGSGPITAIGFQMNATSLAGNYTYTVRMGHTSLAVLTHPTNFADNYNVDGVTTMANAATFSIPAGIPSGEWFWLPLPDGVFNYNGTDNLLVEVEVPVASATNSIRMTTMGTNIRLYSTAAGATGSLSVDAVGNHMKFRFNGGTMNILNGGGFNEVAYFNDINNGKAQYLLRATELGSSGNINSFACRTFSTHATASDYTNTVVTLAHITADVLSTTIATNVAGGTQVFSGTYTMPGSIVPGDYFVIPFSTPFVYDGTDNLVVSISSDTGDPVNCSLTSGYTDQKLSTTDYVNVSGSLTAFKPEVRLTLSK